jgi:citronellol/citronellal dehydrogenase
MPYRSVFRPDLFAGQTVIVTGGGSGFGRCMAHELAALGARPVLIGRKPEKLEAVAAELAADAGVEAGWFVCDIRVEASVVETVQAIVAKHGPVHGLINNAGGQFPAAAEKISQNGWEAVVRTNLTGGFLMSREVYLQSMQQTGGAIVNIVADVWRSMPDMAHSGAARSGMIGLTETLAIEWARSAVRVNSVAPGWCQSSGFDTYTNPKMQELLRNMKRLSPMHRVGTEAEVSAAVLFLLSPAAAFITGSCIRVDGGVPNVRHYYPIPEDTRPTEPFDGFHRAVKPKILGD